MLLLLVTIAANLPESKSGAPLGGEEGGCKEGGGTVLALICGHLRYFAVICDPLRYFAKKISPLR